MDTMRTILKLYHMLTKDPTHNHYGRNNTSFPFAALRETRLSPHFAFAGIPCRLHLRHAFPKGKTDCINMRRARFANRRAPLCLLRPKTSPKKRRNPLKRKAELSPCFSPLNSPEPKEDRDQLKRSLSVRGKWFPWL